MSIAMEVPIACLTGGGNGVGSRIKLKYSRVIVEAIYSRQLDGAPSEKDQIFNVETITEVPGVPSDTLSPAKAWANKEDYKSAAQKLANLFTENFKKYESGSSPEIKAGGPASV